MDIIEDINKNIKCLVKGKKSKDKSNPIILKEYINTDTKYVPGETKYIKGDTNYITGDKEYIKGENVYVEKTSNYEYLKYILLIFILLIGGYVIISVIKDMNDITDKINKQKLTPETISNINANIVQNRPNTNIPKTNIPNTNIPPKNIVKEEDKKPIKKAPIKKAPIKKAPIKKAPIKHVEESDKLKKTVNQQKYIKHSPFDFCWYKVKSNDNSCYLF